ncbi:MAG: HD domain-containing phosphohydrolase [Erysipelotrichaceae bacterium]
MKKNKNNIKLTKKESLPKDRDLLTELNRANKEIAEQIIQKNKREDELKIANKELRYQQSEKADRASELVLANEELEFQKQEKQNRANELNIANKELAFQKKEKQDRADELVIANEELSFQTSEKADRNTELKLANKELRYQQSEKADRASELIIANKELKKQKKEKQDRASELNSANKELFYQTSEKADRASELVIANKELAYQKQEKQDRADELSIANKELTYQMSEKEKRASELNVANKELAYQTIEKANRASELKVANKELAYQTIEKADRASELVIANEELAYQKKEKKNRADELIIANKELAFQKKEKKNRSDELILANKELDYQTTEKKDRASELVIANVELAYQKQEKQNRSNELKIANKELAFQKKEKKNRADELILANKELDYQTTEKTDRAKELVIIKKNMINKDIQIENMQYRSELPGLFSRKYFVEALIKYDIEENLPISIIMGDINGLAIIDDSLGQSTVDDILSKIFLVLKKISRKNDVVIGFSNGEFGLILPKTNELKANEVVSKLRTLKEKVGFIDVSISCNTKTKLNKEVELDAIVKEAVEELNNNRTTQKVSHENNTTNLIMEMLFEKNHREMLHSTRVSTLCEKLAKKLGFDKGMVDRIRKTGMLHDIGKIGIDEDILNKNDKLSDKEWNEIKKHPIIGYRILNASEEFTVHAKDVLQHHERIDGKGYPNAIKGDEISITAKIISIADTYDALISERTYKTPMTKEDALKEIKRCSNTQFDEEIVNSFIEMINEA